MIAAPTALRYPSKMLYPFGNTPDDIVFFCKLRLGFSKLDLQNSDKSHVWNMLQNNSQEMLNMVYRTAFMNASPGSTVMLDAIHALILQQSNSPAAEGFERKAISTLYSRTAYQPSIHDALQRIIAVMLLIMFSVCNEPVGLVQTDATYRRFPKMNLNSNGPNTFVGPGRLRLRPSCTSKCTPTTCLISWNGYSTMIFCPNTAWHASI